jgi:hypothetical protein
LKYLLTVLIHNAGDMRQGAHVAAELYWESNDKPQGFFEDCRSSDRIGDTNGRAWTPGRRRRR